MNPIRKLPITKPSFDESDVKAMAGPLETGWVVQGPNVKAFEDAFAGFTGSPHAIATTSCTTALHLALLAAGIGPGDEVIVPSFSFIASANSVEYCGAKPILCDIDLETFNIDPADAERRITPRTKAIMPVSLFGLPAPMDRIQALCEKHGLLMLEDAACAAGSRIGNRHSGAWGIGAAFSFHPRKAITTGEGGMFVTPRADLAAKIRSLRDHGAGKSDLERHRGKGGSLLPDFDVLGFNYRMTDIQGALGANQMRKLPAILEGRRAGAAIYDRMLADLPFLRLPYAPAGHTHAYQSYVTIFTGKSGNPPSLQTMGELNVARNALMASLEEQGISVRQGTHAIHTLGYYRKKYGFAETDLPNALMADRLTITLPLFGGLSEEDVDYVKSRLLGLVG